MTWQCDLIAPFNKLKGNMVSHSNRKKIRHFKTNLQQMTLYSDVLKKSFSLKIAVKTNRTIVKHGSLDEFLLSRPASKPGNGRDASKILTPLGLKIRKMIKKELENNKAQ
jgi:large subunit ribosomal protein L28